MPQCAVATCRNSHRRTRGRRIRYHRFPQIPEVRMRWVRACGRVPLSNGDVPFNIQTARICSLHFNNESYEKDIEHLVLGLPVRSRLRRGAVPTLGVPVNVQPVTKMLVEDAKRSLLKVAHATIIKEKKIGNVAGDGTTTLDDNFSRASRNTKSRKDIDEICENDAYSTNESNNDSKTRYLYGHSKSGNKRERTEQQQQQSSYQSNKRAGNDSFTIESTGEQRKMADIDVLLALGLKPAPRLNKMHAAAEYGSGGATGKKSDARDKREEDSRGSPKVPQSRQNGAALPEETATAMATSASAANSERLRPTVKSENHSDTETEEQSTAIDCPRSRRRSIDEIPADSRNSSKKTPANVARVVKNERDNGRKRRSTDDPLGTNCGPQSAKKICFEQRERFIDSLIGNAERVSADELADRADQLRAEVQALDELARAKEMEWNEILSMRKLKEEAYLRIERRRQVVGYMEANGQSSDNLPPASLTLIPEWESSGPVTKIGENSSRISSQDSGASRDVKEMEDVRLIETQETSRSDEVTREISLVQAKREKSNVAVKSSNNAQRRTSSPKQLAENGRKHQQRNQQQQHQLQQQQQRLQQQFNEQQSLDNRQIGEGRQGPIVDVRSIIADYRLRHPETVPRRYDNKKDSPARPRETATNTRTSGLINVRRGRRMRNSVNISLGAGGAMVETTPHHNIDSRPSSTDSCKSSNERIPNDPNNSMSFKDVLVQFAKLSQQQGEPVKTPQNYPDVTLHPVAPTTVTINSAPTQQSTGSLLHGILTKSQSPRPTTFSPTLARLLTAPERERTNVPTSITAVPQQNIQTQHLLQTYQGSNPVSISDLLSSSKARTEITITPVVTPMTPSHTSQSNSVVHVDDVEEESSLLDERDSRLGSGARDNRDERESPPRCQGCQERAAQFVCAGCGNQWYCSRDCQVAAWDEHSEVCSG